MMKKTFALLALTTALCAASPSFAQGYGAIISPDEKSGSSSNAAGEGSVLYGDTGDSSGSGESMDGAAVTTGGDDYIQAEEADTAGADEGGDYIEADDADETDAANTAANDLYGSGDETDENSDIYSYVAGEDTSKTPAQRLAAKRQKEYIADKARRDKERAARSAALKEKRSQAALNAKARADALLKKQGFNIPENTDTQ